MAWSLSKYISGDTNEQTSATWTDNLTDQQRNFLKVKGVGYYNPQTNQGSQQDAVAYMLASESYARNGGGDTPGSLWDQAKFNQTYGSEFAAASAPASAPAPAAQPRIGPGDPSAMMAALQRLRIQAAATPPAASAPTVTAPVATAPSAIPRPASPAAPAATAPALPAELPATPPAAAPATPAATPAANDTTDPATRSLLQVAQRTMAMDDRRRLARTSLFGMNSAFAGGALRGTLGGN